MSAVDSVVLFTCLPNLSQAYLLNANHQCSDSHAKFLHLFKGLWRGFKMNIAPHPCTPPPTHRNWSGEYAINLLFHQQLSLRQTREKKCGFGCIFSSLSPSASMSPLPSLPPSLSLSLHPVGVVGRRWALMGKSSRHDALGGHAAE